nr:unnamed protein product [Digitaria exilis]
MSNPYAAALELDALAATTSSALVVFPSGGAGDAGAALRLEMERWTAGGHVTPAAALHGLAGHGSGNDGLMIGDELCMI